MYTANMWPQTQNYFYLDLGRKPYLHPGKNSRI